MENVAVLLLVDDEALIRDSFATMLEDGRFSVVQAYDSEAAIGRLDRENYHSGLITDNRIGAGTTGGEVARHARVAYLNIATVYMSGDSTADWGPEAFPTALCSRSLSHRHNCSPPSRPC